MSSLGSFGSHGSASLATSARRELPAFLTNRRSTSNSADAHPATTTSASCAPAVVAGGSSRLSSARSTRGESLIAAALRRRQANSSASTPRFAHNQAADAGAMPAQLVQPRTDVGVPPLHVEPVREDVREEACDAMYVGPAHPLDATPPPPPSMRAEAMMQEEARVLQASESQSTEEDDDDDGDDVIEPDIVVEVAQEDAETNSTKPHSTDDENPFADSSNDDDDGRSKDVSGAHHPMSMEHQHAIHDDANAQANPFNAPPPPPPPPPSMVPPLRFLHAGIPTRSSLLANNGLTRPPLQASAPPTTLNAIADASSAVEGKMAAAALPPMVPTANGHNTPREHREEVRMPADPYRRTWAASPFTRGENIVDDSPAPATPRDSSVGELGVAPPPPPPPQQQQQAPAAMPAHPSMHAHQIGMPPLAKPSPTQQLRMSEVLEEEDHRAPAHLSTPSQTPHSGGVFAATPSLPLPHPIVATEEVVEEEEVTNPFADASPRDHHHLPVPPPMSVPSSAHRFTQPSASSPTHNPFAPTTSTAAPKAIHQRQRCVAIFIPNGGIIASFGGQSKPSSAMARSQRSITTTTASSSSSSHRLAYTSIDEVLCSLQAQRIGGLRLRGSSAGRSRVELTRMLAASPYLRGDANAAESEAWLGKMEACGTFNATLMAVLKVVLRDALRPDGDEAEPPFVWANGGRQLLLDAITANTNKEDEVRCSPAAAGPTSATTSPDEALAEVERLLLRGEREAAAESARRARLFSHALLISMMCATRDAYQETVKALVQQELSTTSSLAHAYALFANMSYHSLAGIDYATDDDRQQLATCWRQHVRMILANYMKQGALDVVRLGDELLRCGRVAEAHTCFLIAHLSPLGSPAMRIRATRDAPPPHGPNAEQAALMKDLRERLTVLGGHRRSGFPCRAGFVSPISMLLTDVLQAARRGIDAHVPPQHPHVDEDDEPQQQSAPIPWHGLPARPLRYELTFLAMQRVWLQELGLVQESETLLRHLLQRLPPMPPTTSSAAPPSTLTAFLLATTGQQPSPSQAQPAMETMQEVVVPREAPPQPTPPPPQQQQPPAEAQPTKRAAPAPVLRLGKLMPPPHKAEVQPLPPTREAAAPPPVPAPVAEAPPSSPRESRSISTTNNAAAEKAAPAPSRRSRSLDAIVGLFRRGGANKSANQKDDAKPMIIDTEKPPEYDPVTGRWMFPETEEEKAQAALVKQGPPKPKNMPQRETTPADAPASTNGSSATPLRPMGSGLVKAPPRGPLGAKRLGARPQYVDMFNGQ